MDSPPQSQSQSQSPLQARRSRMSSIRGQLKIMPIFAQTTNNLENKLKKKKKRKQSIKMEMEADCIPFTQSQINQILDKQEQHVKGMTKFLQRYQLGEKIGEGAHGFVRKCYLKTTRQLFAVKTLHLDQQHIQFLKKNFKFIKSLQHPNIIKYYFLYLDSKNSTCHLIMDYNSSPSLLKYSCLTQSQIKHIIYELISTLSYIHSENICHRDIKPDNILYDQENKKITIIDFGISKKIVERETKKLMLTITGTLYYRAPEMFLGGGYDEKVDMWAVGITLYQLINKGKTPFQSQYLSNTIDNILRGQVQYNQQIWCKYDKFAKDLVYRLLKKNTDRLSANEALKHFWFDQMHQPGDITKSLSYGNNWRRKQSPQKKNPKYVIKEQNINQDQLNFFMLRSLTMTKQQSIQIEQNKSQSQQQTQAKQELEAQIQINIPSPENANSSPDPYSSPSKSSSPSPLVKKSGKNTNRTKNSIKVNSKQLKKGWLNNSDDEGILVLVDSQEES